MELKKTRYKLADHRNPSNQDIILVAIQSIKAFQIYMEKVMEIFLRSIS